MTNPMDDLLTDAKIDSAKVRRASEVWATFLWNSSLQYERDKGPNYFLGRAFDFVCERAELMMHRKRVDLGLPDLRTYVMVSPLGQNRWPHDLRSAW